MEIASILIVEAHPGFCRILKDLLAAAPEIRIVGEVADADKLTGKMVELEPDVVLVDINLAGISGLSISRAIRQIRPAARVVILAEEDSTPYRLAFRSVGASAWVRKASMANELVPCIRALLGEGVVSDTG